MESGGLMEVGETEVVTQLGYCRVVVAVYGVFFFEGEAGTLEGGFMRENEGI